MVWSNPVPNSARSLYPVYLIREKETNEKLLDEIIPVTDRARNDLNNNGIAIGEQLVQVDIKDTMKDLKFKKSMCGLRGVACILCKSKVEDWTNEEKIKEGFPVHRCAADTREIFNSVVHENGNIVIKPGDFDMRSGVTKEAISDSDQHLITITHSYINGCTWYMEMLYHCYADYQRWEEKSTALGEPIRRAKEIVRDSIHDETGLKLDYVNSAGAKGGTSTTGEQLRAFFTDKCHPVINALLSKPNNIKHQEHMLNLHQ